jgi:hypothetical protein
LQVGGIEAGREDIIEDLPAIVENAQNLLIAGILDGGLDNQ